MHVDVHEHVHILTLNMFMFLTRIYSYFAILATEAIKTFKQGGIYKYVLYCMLENLGKIWFWNQFSGLALRSMISYCNR
jgi:hypothetical protein